MNSIPSQVIHVESELGQFTLYKPQSVNCYNPGYMIITWVAIEFIPYNLIHAIAYRIFFILHLKLL